jgi:hypothetical protein
MYSDMDKFDKLFAIAFKATIVLYFIVFFFHDEFRPDIYRSVSVPLEYCLALMMVYLGGRWALTKLGFYQGGFKKPNARTLLKTLGIISALILLCVGIEFVFHDLDVTKQALADLQASTVGQTVLGNPNRAGLVITGEMHLRGNDGAAGLSIPVKGCRAAGELDVRGVRKDGSWIISALYLIADGQKTIVQIPH